MNKVIAIVLLYLSAISCDDERRYCGTILVKDIERPTSGYKTHTDACYFIIMKVDTIDAAIRVNLTVPAWYSYKINDRVCFDLSEMDMYVYGNGDKHLIN